SQTTQRHTEVLPRAGLHIVSAWPRQALYAFRIDCCGDRPYIPEASPMKSVATFAVRYRWWVIAGWLVFILLAQGAASSLGGANYKDTFSLPATETDKVMTLLKDSGQKDQSGLSGQVVFHSTSGTLAQPPEEVMPALRGLCAANLSVVRVDSPWGTIS